MTEGEFLGKIDLADLELAEQGIPPFQREFRIFQKLVPDYEGPLLGATIDPDSYPAFVGPNLLKRIGDWLAARYGEAAYVQNLFGRVPCLLRGQVYLIRIPICFGQVRFSAAQILDNYVEGLTPNFAQSLRHEEAIAIARTFIAGYGLIYEVEDMRTICLENKKSKLDESAGLILIKAIEDRDQAVDCLAKRFPDLGNAAFHAQQHGEKMLKGFLIAKNFVTEEKLRRKPFGHDLRRVFDECVKNEGRFEELEAEVTLLTRVGMSVRYTEPPNTLKEAFDIVWASLRLGGASASAITGLPRRGM